MVRGVCACEVVLNDRYKDVIVNVPVDLQRFNSGEKRKQIVLSLGNTLRIYIIVLAKNGLISIRRSIR